MDATYTVTLTDVGVGGAPPAAALRELLHDLEADWYYDELRVVEIGPQEPREAAP